MNEISYRRNFVRIGVIHVVVIAAIVLAGLLRTWWAGRARPEAVTFVSLEPPPHPPPPEPEIEPPPEPEPQPEPKPPEKKTIIVNTNRVKRVNRPPPPEPRPAINADLLKRQLASAVSVGTPGPADRIPGWYYAMVRRKMYEAWDQPSASVVSPGKVARLAITVRRDGAITQRTLAKSSGSPILDASALKAVQSVDRLDALPDEFAGTSKEITIDFKLTRNNS